MTLQFFKKLLMDILLNIIAFYGKMVGFIATDISERLNDPMTNRYEPNHERMIVLDKHFFQHKIVTIF